MKTANWTNHNKSNSNYQCKLKRMEMKKAILSLAIILGLAATSMAQVEIKCGGGINLAGFSKDFENYTVDGRIGYQFGAGVLIGQKFYVEPSVYWLRVAQYAVLKDDPEQIESLIALNSIRIPVHVGYHIIGGKEEKLFALRVFAGPAANILTKVTSDLSDVTKDDFKSFGVDIDAGLGIDIWFIFLDAQYSWGLTKVWEEGSDAKLRGFSANAGIRIPF
jgi:Outer membrane protein beta-barrel domain